MLLLVALVATKRRVGLKNVSILFEINFINGIQRISGLRLWNLYNSRVNSGESIRVFPLSNWTELDIWLYIYRENIPIVPLYYAAERPVVRRGGMWIMVDDDRLPIEEGEFPK